MAAVTTEGTRAMTTDAPTCFVNAGAFADFPDPFVIHGVDHRGSRGLHKMRVDGVRRVIYNDPYRLEAWVRESSVDASTDHRTVILYAFDIAIPDHLRFVTPAEREPYIRRVFVGLLLRNSDHTSRAVDSAMWSCARSTIIDDNDDYVRVLHVEDLS
jgi:hypothetical protein